MDSARFTILNDKQTLEQFAISGFEEYFIFN